MNTETRFRKSTLRSAILIALSINGTAMTLSDGAAHADNQACGTPIPATGSANFTMLTSAGHTMTADGGANDVVMTWDGTAFTASSDYTGPGSATNMTLSSSDPFFGASWVAHDIQVFAPGSYTFDAGDNTPGAGTGGAAGSNNEAVGTMLNVTVPAGKLGMHMLFDWSGNNNIDVFIVADPSSVFGASIGRSTTQVTASSNLCDGNGGTAAVKNCLFDGKPTGSAGKPLGSQVWMLASIDGNGDGVMGIPMPAGGPFGGFNANFNLRGTLALTSGTVCNPTTVVHPFVFTDLTGQAINTTYTSNPITVSYDSGSGSVSVTISGGQYSKNGDPYTSADGTAVVGDTFTVQQTTGSAEDGTTTPASLSIGGVNDSFDVKVIDKKPAAFSFTDQTGVATSTLVESDTIIVSGMDTGLTTPINITGGEYSKDGGTTWTNLAGTVTNTDTVKVRQTSSATGATTTDAILTLGSAGNGTAVSDTFSVRTAGGYNSSGNNFTMLDGKNSATGGTNDVIMAWDQQYNTSGSDPVTTTTAHMQLSSVTDFFQHLWTAHHIRVFGPGSYTINTDNTECPISKLETTGCTPSSTASKNYAFTVGANQIAVHILFDWNGTFDIDVVNIYEKNAVFSPSQLNGSAPQGHNDPLTVWDLMSSDSTASCPGALDGAGAPINCSSNGINGIPMIDGPFKGFSANFNLRYVGTAASSSYTPTVNISDPSGGGGCSIATSPVESANRADWWLVAGFLAWLGGIQFRFKRRQAKS